MQSSSEKNNETPAMSGNEADPRQGRGGTDVKVHQVQGEWVHGRVRQPSPNSYEDQHSTRQALRADQTKGPSCCSLGCRQTRSLVRISVDGNRSRNTTLDSHLCTLGNSEVPPGRRLIHVGYILVVSKFSTYSSSSELVHY